jgi:hypothetical protein
MNKLLIIGLSRKIGTLTTRISADLYNEVNKCWQDAIKKVPDGGSLHYTVQPLATAAVQAGEDRGGNSMGLEKVPQCCMYLSLVCALF